MGRPANIVMCLHSAFTTHTLGWHGFKWVNWLDFLFGGEALFEAEAR